MAGRELIRGLTEAKLALFARLFLERFLDPAFGATSKTEIDVLVFSLLHTVGSIDTSKTQYEIARKLRITPSRVRSLKMQILLRDGTQTDAALRDRIIQVISELRFVKDGSVIQFGVEDPLLREDVAARLKKLGATADSSFNRELVRIQLDAFVDFITDLMPEDRREIVREALIKAGMADSSVKGVLLGALAKLGEKVAGSAGQVIAKQAGELAGPAVKALLGSAAGAVTALWRDILGLEQNSDTPPIDV